MAGHETHIPFGGHEMAKGCESSKHNEGWCRGRCRYSSIGCDNGEKLA
jgi:hypothetical protein